MLALRGIYENGVLKLENSIIVNKPLKVIVTFIDEDIQNNYELIDKKKSEKKKKIIDINKFSFIQSIEASKDFTGSFSDALIEERRAELWIYF